MMVQDRIEVTTLSEEIPGANQKIGGVKLMMEETAEEKLKIEEAEVKTIEVEVEKGSLQKIEIQETARAKIRILQKDKSVMGLRSQASFLKSA